MTARDAGSYRLVVFLGALGRCASVPHLHRVACELLSEEFDAEVAALIDRDRVVASVGFGAAEVPVGDMIGLASGASEGEFPSLGRCSTMSVTWPGVDGGRLVIARSGAAFSTADRDLVLGMAGALELAERSIRLIEFERAQHRAYEVLLGIQRAISRRTPLPTVLAEITRGASSMLEGLPVSLVLDNALDPSFPVHVGSPAVEQHSAHVVPVHAHGELVGQLRAGLRDGVPLSEAQRTVLVIFAEHAALALNDAHLLESMKEAFRDPLTGMPNRQLFVERLTAALSGADRCGVSVLYIDLDRFKAVNDSLGHPAGDALLVEAAERLRNAVAPDSSVARFGGDEFALMIRSAQGSSHADHTAQRIIAALARPYTVHGTQVVVGATVGIAHCTDGTSAAEMLADADLAMYHAKALGGGRCAVFEPRMRTQVRDRLELATELSGALDRGELAVHFQPIVDLHSGRPVSAEALLRWHHPTRGSVSPADLIPIAESHGLIVRIGEWVLEEACRHLARWRRDFPDLTVAVNVSVRQLRDPAFVGDVTTILARHGLPTSALTLEVTESAFIHHDDDTVTVIETLAAQGFTIALDDFGTGYSSLSYLHRLPVHVLKIDRSFVSGTQGDKGRRLVDTIIDLGRAYELKVVAEGIEDAEQWAWLVEAGCLLGQGYYFGAPTPAEDVPIALRTAGRRSEAQA